MDTELLRQARQRIARSRSALVLTHQRPDGDALGSMLGLAHMLRAAGKQAVPVLAEGLSSVFRYLPGTDGIRGEVPASIDLTILVDCADEQRIGLPEGSPARPIDLAIDHHVTNQAFAAVSLVDPAAASTAELIVDLAEGLGLTIPRDAAVCLMAGVVTDTLGFRTPNTGIHTLETAAALIRAGGSLSDTVERSLHRRSFAAARYWGAGLSRLERDGGLVWTWLTLADRSAAGYPGRDDADLVNILSSIDGHEVALIFIEQEKGTVKVSWRVVAGLDVTPLALSFGGGGHPAASGALLSGEMDSVREEVLQRTRQWLADAHASRESDPQPGEQETGDPKPSR
jgi:phosphoesterase RecJ-like protein